MTTPAFAANASLPSISVTNNNPALGGASTTFSVTVSNPGGNVYTTTGVSIIAPSGWIVTAAACPGGSFLPVCSSTASGLTASVSSFAVGTAAGIPPGLTDTFTFTATAPTGTYPLNSVFTSKIQDASAVNFYNGPSFTIQVIDPSTVVTLTVTPGGSNTASAYTAGTAAYTLTATITAAEAQSGLIIVWSDTGTGTSGAAFPASFSSATSTTSAATSTTATASVTYQPSEVKGHIGLTTATAVATIGSCTVAAHCSVNSAAGITTSAGAPSSVTVTAGLSSTATDYIVASATPTWTSPTPVLSAEIASAGITGALTDAFGNTVTSGIAAGPTCTILSFGGLFQSGASSTTTDNVAAASCTTAGTITSDENYFQGLTFGTATYVQVSMTGMYNGASFTATGNSQTLSTSSMDTTAVLGTPGLSISVAAGTISAGSASGVVTTLTLTYTLSVNQLGVPITFLGVNASDYGGSFVGGTGSRCYGVCPGGAHTSEYGNVTVASVENTGGTAAIATATYTIDPTLGNSVTFKAQFANPITGTPSHIIGPSAATGAYVTGAGAPSKLSVFSYFTTPLANPTSKVVAGGTIYLDIVLVDFWANRVTCTATYCGAQLQVNLAASPSSAGTFTATSVYIAQGTSDTNSPPSFGLIKFVVSSSAALGVVISATGFYSGSSTLTIVSPNPTITVNTPAGTIGHIVYSKFSGVGFSGSVAASAGYLAGSVTISSVKYSIDGATAVAASLAAPTWTAVPTFSNGLHTIVFTVTDSNGNTASNSTKVLVDTSAPTVTNPTTLAYGAGTAIVFSVVDSEGDLASVSATVNGTALAASQVSITSGTNNPGASVTYSVSVTGLAATTGHYGIALTAKDTAGNSATGTTVVVTVTVAFAQSLVLSGTLSSSTVNGYVGVSATYGNQWSSSQSVIVFAVWKNSLGQTVYVSAGSATIAAGGSQSFFLPEVGLASGSYTVNVSVWTTSNQPVSVQTSLSVTV